MPLRALLLVIEQPQQQQQQQPQAHEDKFKHGSTLLSPFIYPSSSSSSSLRSSISVAGFFPGIATSTGTGEPRASTISSSTLGSSRVSLPHSDADPSPSTTRSSVRSPTISVLHTASGTDYAATSPPHSPPPVLNDIPSIRVPTPYTHLIRFPPEPESPPELDERGRPRLRLNTTVPLVGAALRYYSSVSEDEGEEGVVDIPHGGKEDRRETDGGTRSKLKTDWKTNPRAKPGRRKDDESTINPLYAPTSATPPIRFVREGDQFDKWLDEDTFWAGKRIPKVEFGWWRRSAVEIAEILTKAETKRQRKNKVLAAAAAAAGGDGCATSSLAFDEDAPLPTAHMTELTATHHRTPVACMFVGANWQFPIPVAHLTHEQLVGLAKRGLLVVALPPGQNAGDWDVETLSAVPTAGPWGEERGGRWAARESVPIPALAVVPPSPLLLSHTNSNEASMAGKSAIKEGFTSLFARAKNAHEQFLKPTAYPTTTPPSSSSSYSLSVPSSPPTMTNATSDMSMTEISLSPSILPPLSVPSSPRLSSGSAEAMKNIDTLSVRSSDTFATSSTAGSRTTQWMSWASSKWGRS